MSVLGAQMRHPRSWSERPLCIGESFFTSSFVADGIGCTSTNHSLPHSINLFWQHFAELCLGSCYRPWRRLNVCAAGDLTSRRSRSNNLTQCRINVALHLRDFI